MTGGPSGQERPGTRSSGRARTPGTDCQSWGAPCPTHGLRGSGLKVWGSGLGAWGSGFRALRVRGSRKVAPHHRWPCPCPRTLPLPGDDTPGCSSCWKQVARPQRTPTKCPETDGFRLLHVLPRDRPGSRLRVQGHPHERRGTQHVGPAGTGAAQAQWEVGDPCHFVPLNELRAT